MVKKKNEWNYKWNSSQMWCNCSQWKKRRFVCAEIHMKMKYFKLWVQITIQNNLLKKQTDNDNSYLNSFHVYFRVFNIFPTVHRKDTAIDNTKVFRSSFCVVVTNYCSLSWGQYLTTNQSYPKTQPLSEVRLSC